MQKIIAANWKMYKTRQEARETAAAVAAALNEQPTPHEVVVFAPFTAIAEVADAFAASQAQAGAQDVWPAVEGAFTGEISPRMLQDAGAVWVLTGHSERRHVLGESAARRPLPWNRASRSCSASGKSWKSANPASWKTCCAASWTAACPPEGTRWKAVLL